MTGSRWALKRKQNHHPHVGSAGARVASLRTRAGLNSGPIRSARQTAVAIALHSLWWLPAVRLRPCRNFAKERDLGMVLDIAKLGDAVLDAKPELDLTGEFIGYFNARHP